MLEALRQTIIRGARYMIIFGVAGLLLRLPYAPRAGLMIGAGFAIFTFDLAMWHLTRRRAGR